MQRSIPLGQLLPLFGSLWFAMTAMWSQFWLAGNILCALYLILLFVGAKVLTSPLPLRIARPPTGPSAPQILLGVALSLPTAVYLCLTWQQEYPFGGDHDHHVRMTQQWFQIFDLYILLVPLSLAIAAFLARFTRFAFSLWLVAAFALSFMFTGPMESVVRYPAAFYSLAWPFNVGLTFFPDADPLLALRFVNVLSIPCWLFALRPLVTQRWPDGRALLLACAFLFQKDWIYFGASTYLEPWALIFMLLALETAISDDISDLWRAALLAGIATAFKEQAIFLLGPLLLLAVWQSRRTLGFGRAFLSALLIGLPFTLYYAARRNSNIWRREEAIDIFSDAFQSTHFETYGRMLQEHLHIAGLIVILLVLGLSIFGVWKTRSQRALLALLFASVIASELLYLLDRISLEYVGYPRFHYLTWPLLAAGLVVLYQKRQAWRKPLLAIATAFSLLQLAQSGRLYARALQADYHRNFNEYYFAPMYFPIRSLLNNVPQPRGERELVLNLPAPYAFFPAGLQTGYSRLFSTFRNARLAQGLVCECTSPTQTVLMINLFTPEDGLGVLAIKSFFDQPTLIACVARLEHSCAKVVTEKSGDFIVGAVGYSL
ncbi:MAG: hypothetical protein KF799_01070 [Bdellovibrionales bacterium]|nr:hypothetical protein [Bdellovibrionales bacterium]